MVTLTRWYMAEALADVWDAPDVDVLAGMQARTEALMAEAALHDERDANVCPECDNGIVTVFHSHLRDWETGEYLDIEEVPCTACEAGLLLTPSDAQAADAWLDSFRADEARDYNPEVC